MQIHWITSQSLQGSWIWYLRLLGRIRISGGQIGCTFRLRETFSVSNTELYTTRRLLKLYKVALKFVIIVVVLLHVFVNNVILLFSRVERTANQTESWLYVLGSDTSKASAKRAIHE